MWGSHVRVITRQQEDGIDETRVLEFLNGLESMPILRSANQDERLLEPGTIVRIWFSDNIKSFLYNSIVKRTMVFNHQCHLGLQKMEVSFAQFCAWICPALDVDLIVNEGDGDVIAVRAGDWKEIPGVELLMRTLPQPVSTTLEWPDEAFKRLAECVRPIKDSSGKVLGRGCLATASGLSEDTWRRWHIHLQGTITAGGFRGSITTTFAGLLLGHSMRALRDQSQPIVDTDAISVWASEQAKLVAGLGLSKKHLLMASMGIRSVYGDTGPLPIAQNSNGILTFNDIATNTNVLEKIVIVNWVEWAQLLKERPELSIDDNVFIVENGPLGNMREIYREKGCHLSNPASQEIQWNTQLGAVAEAIAQNWGWELPRVLKMPY